MTTYEKALAYWNNQSLQAPSDIDMALDNFRILFAYHSGKIENPEITYHDTREIFENGEVKGYSGNPRALFETQNQKLCYEFLKSKIVSCEPLSIPLILEVHRILTSGTFDETRFIEKGERPGEFKKHDYVTGRHEVGAYPEDVEEQLAELLSEVNDYNGDKILHVAAYFHARFEYIHPFADGNGRVGRTLLNYYLMIHRHPPLIIYDEDKGGYYHALEQYDTTEELSGFVAFLRQQTTKTWERVTEREKSKEPRKNLDELI
jgi:Uncharacterized conserved protein